MFRLIKTRLASLLLIALVAAAVSCSGRNREADAKRVAEPRSAPPIEVATAPVVERSVRRSIEVVGSLEAEDEVTLSSQSSGELEGITVDIGSPVHRGQVIARLDSRELKLRVEQAQAALSQAEARLGIKSGEKLDVDKQPEVRLARAAMERARYDWTAAQDLVEHGDISRQQFDVARRAFEQAEARFQTALEAVRNLQAVVDEKRAALALAKKQLSDVDIVSPINGAVKEKLASRGEYLQPGKPVVTLVQINPLRLRLEVPETFAASIKKGQAVKLRVESFPGREFEGTIKRIKPSLDEKNRSLTAEAEVPNSSGLLRPGMFARAQVVSKETSVALMVPEKAIVSLAGVNKIFVVDSGHAIERQVKLGNRDGNLVEIVEGVHAGDRVITSNADKLQDGAAVSTTTT